jgi:hypothetical protein
MIDTTTINYYKKSRLESLIDSDHPSYYNKSRLKRYRLKQKYGTHLKEQPSNNLLFDSIGRKYGDICKPNVKLSDDTIITNGRLVMTKNE